MQVLGSTNHHAVHEGPQDSALIERARSGEMAAFEGLYRRHVGRVYALCLRMTGVPADAEDCTQQTFIKAWEKLDSFRGDSSFATWLHRIAVNEVLGRQRKRSRRGVHLELVDDGAGLAPLRMTPHTDAGIDLERAIGALPDGARAVFVLYAVNGYSHREASEMLGIAVGTCKAQLHRARKLLLEAMNG